MRDGRVSSSTLLPTIGASTVIVSPGCSHTAAYRSSAKRAISARLRCGFRLRVPLQLRLPDCLVLWRALAKPDRTASHAADSISARCSRTSFITANSIFRSNVFVLVIQPESQLRPRRSTKGVNGYESETVSESETESETESESEFASETSTRGTSLARRVRSRPSGC